MKKFISIILSMALILTTGFALAAGSPTVDLATVTVLSPDNVHIAKLGTFASMYEAIIRNGGIPWNFDADMELCLTFYDGFDAYDIVALDFSEVDSTKDAMVSLQFATEYRASSPVGVMFVSIDDGEIIENLVFGKAKTNNIVTFKVPACILEIIAESDESFIVFFA